MPNLRVLLTCAAPAALALFAAACGGTTRSLTLGQQPSLRHPVDPLPIVLTDRAVGGPMRPAVALAVADSVLRGWGWRVAAVDERRAELRTEWLYFAMPSVVPTAGQQCEADSDVGMRLSVRRHAGAGDSVQFAVRGELRVLAGADRDDVERMARAGFDAVSAALQEGLRRAAERPVGAPVQIARVSGEGGVADGGQWYGCTTVRP